MRKAVKLLAGICAGMCGYCAVVDAMGGYYAMALMFGALFVLNLFSLTEG